MTAAIANLPPEALAAVSGAKSGLDSCSACSSVPNQNVGGFAPGANAGAAADRGSDLPDH